MEDNKWGQMYGRPHRLRQAYGDRRETGVKKSKNTNTGLRNITKCLSGKLFLPAPDFGLPSSVTKVSIKITEEPL